MLGPVECLVAGQPVVLGRVQERCVLAVLLLNLGRVVSVARLVELLWDGQPPARAQALVHTQVSRLRSTLRAAGAETYGVRLLTRGAGYTIEVRPDMVDAYRFRSLVEQARQDANPAVRSARLREALALWRGPAIADATTSRIDGQIRAGLDEQRLAALEDRIEADLADGRHLELVPELTDLVAQHPLRERLVGLLMLALYRSGQQARALATYRHTRQLLIDELGIEPAAELRRLEQAMLTQDPALDPPISNAPPLPAAASTSWRGPRSHLTSIIGRQGELATLTKLLHDHRLVTVVGVGGVGKTTLALHAAEAAAAALPRDVAVAALAPARDEDDLVFTVGALLGINGANVPETLDGIERFLRERPHLLVLDNCEHLTAACARILRRLLSASPRLVVLATSREPLGLPEETVWRLEPLQVPDHDRAPAPSVPSVALFLRRAGESVLGFTPSPADLAAIGRICRRVDGLPLALELAASRLRALQPDRLADHLEEGFGLLTDVGATPSALVATLDWSYRLLAPLEQRLLARLSVFRGGFDAATAQRVCDAAPLTYDQVLPTLASLVDRSLVQPYDVSGAPRYRLLEVVRDYAAIRLAALEPTSEIADRHLSHWLNTARSIATLPTIDAQMRGWNALEADIDNLRAAAEYGYESGRSADVVELTTLLYNLWQIGPHRDAEKQRWLERAEAHLLDCRPEIRCVVVFSRICILSAQDDNVAALELLPVALPELHTHRTAEYLEARIVKVRTLIRLLSPDSLTEAADVVALARTATDAHYQLHALAAHAEALITWGRYDEAAELCGRLDLTGAAANSADVARLLMMRCLAALGRGDLARAVADEALLREELTGKINFLHHAQPALPRALLALATESPQRARNTVATIVAQLDERYPPTTSWAYRFRILLAEAERRLGRLDRALSTLADGLAQGINRSDFTKTLPAVLVAALLAADLGDDETSEALARDWDRLRRRLGLPAPLSFAAVVSSRLGIDPDAPAPGPADDERDGQEIHRLIRRSYEWCLLRIGQGARTWPGNPLPAGATPSRLPSARPPTRPSNALLDSEHS